MEESIKNSTLPNSSCVVDSPKVSVIVPTYNRADRLERALNSIVSQTYQDFELIVVDDGSTDKTSQLMKSFPKAQYFYIKKKLGSF